MVWRAVVKRSPAAGDCQRLAVYKARHAGSRDTSPYPMVDASRLGGASAGRAGVAAPWLVRRRGVHGAVWKACLPLQARDASAPVTPGLDQARPGEAWPPGVPAVAVRPRPAPGQPRPAGVPVWRFDAPPGRFPCPWGSARPLRLSNATRCRASLQTRRPTALARASGWATDARPGAHN